MLFKRWHRWRSVNGPFSYIYGMLYCFSECGSISIMQLRTIYCNTYVFIIHFMRAYVYLHLHMFVIPLIYSNTHFKYIKKAL